MRVLMLGWEFPPHISGGLGTACLGLAEGLAHHGVDVTFVVPRVFGDEDSRFARLLGAADVELAPDDVSVLGLDVADAIGEVPGGAPAGAELAELAERLRVLAVDSTLAPYASPEVYAERMGGRGGGPRGEAEERGDQAGAGPVDAGTAARLPFRGSYGPDLFAEVGRYARVVEALARRESFDVVHAHDWMTFPAGVVAARTSGRPLVAHLHASEYDRSGENVNVRVLEIERMGLVSADRVICVSNYLASVVRERYAVDAGKVRVVYNAVSHREPSFGGGEEGIDDPIVLFLGRVTFQKGPDYFVEAAARVARVMPRVKFVVSGSGDMLPQIMERAAELGIARQVHFTGFLRGTEVDRMYGMADIYVMPSVSEPFGISSLEAMAAEVPVILSKQSGVSEVVSNALKVDFWDVDDMADKILALLRHPALGRQLVDEGRGEVGRQRWDLRGGVVRGIYEEVAS